MRVHVLKNIMIDGDIILPGKETDVTVEQYDNLRRDGAIETLGERDARAKADELVASARATAESQAAEAEKSARAVASQEADKARSDAEAEAGAKKSKRAAS